MYLYLIVQDHNNYYEGLHMTFGVLLLVSDFRYCILPGCAPL